MTTQTDWAEWVTGLKLAFISLSDEALTASLTIEGGRHPQTWIAATRQALRGVESSARDMQDRLDKIQAAAEKDPDGS
jgi:hypothetical protein